LWSEPLARGWNELLRAVRQQFALSPRLKELGVCTVAKLTGAHYEFIHHAPEYVKAGGSAEALVKLDAPDAAAVDPVFSADEQLVIRYAIAMTREVAVPESLFAEIRARFNETEIVELTATIGTYNLVARFLVALQRRARTLMQHPATMSRILHRSLRVTLPTAVAAEGVTITDRDGRRYIDASGGAAVSCLGTRTPTCWRRCTRRSTRSPMRTPASSRPMSPKSSPMSWSPMRRPESATSIW
jgi:alkylhydroperoxidase family enzyme